MITCKKCGSNEIYHSAFVETNGYELNADTRKVLHMYTPNVVRWETYFCVRCEQVYTPSEMTSQGNKSPEIELDDLEGIFEM